VRKSCCMLITGEIKSGMQRSRSDKSDELLRQIYSSFVRLKIDLDELRRIEATHLMIDQSHELKLAIESLDDIRERVLVCHAIYKAYWHRGDIQNQIQEMVDRFDD